MGGRPLLLKYEVRVYGPATTEVDEVEDINEDIMVDAEYELHRLVEWYRGLDVQVTRTG